MEKWNVHFLPTEIIDDWLPWIFLHKCVLSEPRSMRNESPDGCLKTKVREKSRECHSHKPQPFQDTKG